MPNPINARRAQQWQSCDQCGRLFPMERLVKQKGKMICTSGSCFDDLEVERRPWVIAQTLGPTSEVEGADLRMVDRGFFEGFDEVQR